MDELPRIETIFFGSNSMQFGKWPLCVYSSTRNTYCPSVLYIENKYLELNEGISHKENYKITKKKKLFKSDEKLWKLNQNRWSSETSPDQPGRKPFISTSNSIKTIKDLYKLAESMQYVRCNGTMYCGNMSFGYFFLWNMHWNIFLNNYNNEIEIILFHPH